MYGRHTLHTPHHTPHLYPLFIKIYVHATKAFCFCCTCAAATPHTCHLGITMPLRFSRTPPLCRCSARTAAVSPAFCRLCPLLPAISRSLPRCHAAACRAFHCCCARALPFRVLGGFAAPACLAPAACLGISARAAALARRGDGSSVTAIPKAGMNGRRSGVAWRQAAANNQTWTRKWR